MTTAASFLRAGASWKLVFTVCCLLWTAQSLIACDDTLLLILTAKDPNSEFSRSIREFNRRLSALGAALLAKREAIVPTLLEQLMTSWMEFSNTYAFNPPKIAGNDHLWPEKIRRGGETIGLIRRLVREGNLQEAHNQVLAFNGRIGEFFTATDLDPTKRLFLEAASLFAAMEIQIAGGDVVTLRHQAASLPILLENYVALLPPEPRDLSQTVATAITVLQDHLRITDKANATTAFHVEKVKAHFQELRARILMQEWFPGADQDSSKPTQVAAPASPATTVTAPPIEAPLPITPASSTSGDAP